MKIDWGFSLLYSFACLVALVSLPPTWLSWWVVLFCLAGVWFENGRRWWRS